MIEIKFAILVLIVGHQQVRFEIAVEIAQRQSHAPIDARPRAKGRARGGSYLFELPDDLPIEFFFVLIIEKDIRVLIVRDIQIGIAIVVEIASDYADSSIGKRFEVFRTVFEPTVSLIDPQFIGLADILDRGAAVELS